jgi:hypothetical protein
MVRSFFHGVLVDEGELQMNSSRFAEIQPSDPTLTSDSTA